MARAHGVIDDESGYGGTAGLVGDLPVEEAFRAVEEGRVHLDWDPSPEIRVRAIRMLLDGLGVADLAELHRCVEIARASDEACLACGAVTASACRCDAERA
jgi:hypothetical protein